MDIQTFIIVILAGLVFMFWYSHKKLEGKVLCRFRRANKTITERMVSLKHKTIIFDGGKYNVDPKRIVHYTYRKGINSIFPVQIPSLDYSWDSPDPHDPETYINTWDDPQTRLAAEQGESFRAFSKGVDAQTGKKSRFPEWLFPAITIGAIVIVGYLVYQMSGQIAFLMQQAASGGG